MYWMSTCSIAYCSARAADVNVAPYRGPRCANRGLWVVRVRYVRNKVPWCALVMDEIAAGMLRKEP